MWINSELLSILGLVFSFVVLMVCFYVILPACHRAIRRSINLIAGDGNDLR